MVANKLTAKQRMFVAEYIVSLNATDAARKAGYSEKTADRIGPELLGKTCVSESIQKALSDREKRTLVTADYVILGFKEVVERCLQHKPVMVFDKEAREYVQAKDEEGEGIWEFDSGGANKALEMLGKHLKLFTEKTEVSGPNGGPIPVANVDISKMSIEEIERELVKLEQLNQRTKSPKTDS